MNDFPAIPVYVFGILLLIFSVPARGNDGSEKEEQSHQSGSIQRIDLQKSHSFTDFGDHVLSPDSRYIACSHNSEISVFDRKENFQIVKTYSHKNDVMSISFSPSGEYLVSGGKDGEIKIRKGKNQFREIATYVNESRIQDLSFSPQGRFLVSTTLEDVVSIRSSEEQFHEVYRFKTEEKEATIQSIGFSPDGKYLLLANSAGKKEYKKGGKEPYTILTIFQAEKNFEKVKSFFAQKGTPYHFQFSPDGTYLAVGSTLEIKVYRVRKHFEKVISYKSEKLNKSFPFNDLTGSVAVGFSPDSKYLVSGNVSGTVSIRNVNNNFEQVHSYNTKSGIVQSVTFEPSGRYMASGGNDNTVRIIDMKNDFKKSFHYSHENHIEELTFSHDGRYLVSSSTEGVIKIMDIIRK